VFFSNISISLKGLFLELGLEEGSTFEILLGFEQNQDISEIRECDEADKSLSSIV
jgi:hypothetical protein